MKAYILQASNGAMSSPESVIFTLWAAAILLLCLIFGTVILIRIFRRTRSGPPLIYVCHTSDGRIAFVSKRDFDAACKRAWKAVKKGKVSYDFDRAEESLTGMTIAIPANQVFVYPTGSEAAGWFFGSVHCQEMLFKVPGGSRSDGGEPAIRYWNGEKADEEEIALSDE